MAAEDDEEADEILESLEIDWDSLIDVFAPELEEAAVIGGSQVLRAFQVTDSNIFDTVHQSALDFAQKRAAQLVGMHRLPDGTFERSKEPGIAITKTTRQMLSGTVRRGITEGWSSAELQTAIMQNYAFSPVRALRIARTETNFARNHGGLEAARATGVINRKGWDVRGESCDICQANAAQGMIALDEVFVSGDQCAPAHPNCTCGMSYSAVDDE